MIGWHRPSDLRTSRVADGTLGNAASSNQMKLDTKRIDFHESQTKKIKAT